MKIYISLIYSNKALFTETQDISPCIPANNAFLMKFGVNPKGFTPSQIILTI